MNLPQTIGSDHRDWFDTNESFLDLDTKLKTLWDDSGSAASAIDALQELTATLQTDLTSLEGTVDTHTSALSTINEALVLINGTLATLNTSVATKFDSAGIADPYDADHGIYAVGDVVTYNGQRYVCSTAVTAAEPFDADKWTAEDIQTVIDSIKSSLTAFISVYAKPANETQITITSNSFIDSTDSIHVNMQAVYANERPAGAVCSFYFDSEFTNLVNIGRSAFGVLINVNTSAVIPIVYNAANGFVVSESAITAGTYQLAMTAKVER
ncbi:MAG: hypothetical protein J6W35_06865 [Eubacterium sp.]|nr:hypothetical protein [Eubacterium sp.]